MRKGLLLLLVTGLGACAQQDPNDRVVFEPDPTLPSDSCISVSQIRSTEVLDNQNILFRMRGGQVYRNFMQRRCPGLGLRDAFSYRPRSSQLCNVDVITVLEDVGLGQNQGANCALGDFYPMTEEEAAALKDEIERARDLGLTR